MVFLSTTSKLPHVYKEWLTVHCQCVGNLYGSAILLDETTTTAPRSIQTHGRFFCICILCTKSGTFPMTTLYEKTSEYWARASRSREICVSKVTEDTDVTGVSAMEATLSDLQVCLPFPQHHGDQPGSLNFWAYPNCARVVHHTMASLQEALIITNGKMT